MNYPSWDVPFLGGGMLIAIIATLHVFISHFAVGGGLFLVLTERRAYLARDEELLAFVKRHTLVFVLLVMVLGAVSGTGIWWSIGLVNPAATSALLHVFLWAWGIEWVLFAVEVTAAFVYYYGFDALDRQTHLRVGWVYVVAAWLSLVVINGILTFMLTPGDWLVTHALGDAWWNPTMLPSLVVRTAVCVALAGLYALLTVATIESDALRLGTTRYAATWVLAGSAVLPVGGAWYISRLPAMAREISMGGAAAITMFAAMSVAISVAIVSITFVAAYWQPRFFNVVLAVLLAGMGLSVTGVTEMVREAVRKPFIIYNYMYSSSVRVEDMAAVRQRGVLASARFVTLHSPDPARPNRTGHELFRVQCGGCHTVDGNLGLRPMVKGWREEFIQYQLEHLSELKGYMPPFLGTLDERRALARWLETLGKGKPMEAAPPDEPLPEDDGSGPELAIPAPDPLDLPAPPELLEALLVITFLLHLVPMNLILGGAPLAAWAAWMASARTLSGAPGDAAASPGPDGQVVLSGPDAPPEGGEAAPRQAASPDGTTGSEPDGDVHRALLATLAHLLPAATAFTITLGIAPLLFLQVRYGPQFFPAVIAMAWPWLGLLGLLGVGYYSTYGLAFGHAAPKGRVLPLALAIGASVCFALVAFLFTRMAMMMLEPATVGSLLLGGSSGLHLDAALPATIPRLLHFVLGALAVTGLALALLARAGCVAGAADAIDRLGRRLFRDATLLQLGSGVLFLMSLPPAIRQSFLGGNPLDTAVLAVSAGLAVVAVLLVEQSLGRATAAIGLTLMGMVWTRHRVRALALLGVEASAGGSAWGHAAPLSGGSTLFLIVLLAGAWVITRLARTYWRALQAAPRP